MEYHNIDGTGWPDAVVVDNGGDIFEHTYETRVYFPVDRDALLEMLRMFEADASLGPYQSEEDAAHETLYTRANVIDHIRRMRDALGVES